MNDNPISLEIHDKGERIYLPDLSLAGAIEAKRLAQQLIKDLNRLLKNPPTNKIGDSNARP
jgi:hypothetical protein